MRNHHTCEFRVVKIQLVPAFHERWAVAPAAIDGQQQTSRTLHVRSLREISSLQRCSGEQRGCGLHKIAPVHGLSQADKVENSRACKRRSSNKTQKARPPLYAIHPANHAEVSQRAPRICAKKLLLLLLLV